MSNTKPPEILNEKPDPIIETNIFHKTTLVGWSGLVKINKIHGWASNRRIDIFRIKCESEFGRVPTDEEISNFMLSEPDFQIRELARSILYNGVRVPLILDWDGTLLDGNRRYVATQRTIKNNPWAKDTLENIPAWVLVEGIDEEDKQKILVECNFLSDWKVDWPNYVKASTIYEDYTDRGSEYDDLSERYGLTKAKIRTWIKVMGLIQEFMSFYDHSSEALWVAYEHFPWFEEAHNKYRAKLDADPDFKEQFFTWMIEGKFKSLTQIRRLGEVRDNEEAWAIIRSDSPDAVDTAIHIVQGEKLPDLAGSEKKIKKLIKQLKKLTEEEIASISPMTIADLRITILEITAMSRAAQQAKTGESNDSENRATSG